MINWLYKTFLFKTFLFNDSVDPVIEKTLKNCLMTKILSIEKTSHYQRVRFSNGLEYYFWDANKWYAWLSHGTFFDDQDNSIVYRYVDGRPTAKTMWRLKKAIENFHLEKLVKKDPDIEAIYQRISDKANEST